MTSYQKLKAQVEFYKRACEESNRRIRALVNEPNSELALIAKVCVNMEDATERMVFMGDYETDTKFDGFIVKFAQTQNT